MWDPAEPGAGPAELGRHEGGVKAVAVLPDGRVVTGGDAGFDAAGCWCGTRRSRAPARPSSAATTAGWRRWRCCRTGGWSPAAVGGRVLVWDPAEPGAGPVELGRHEGGVKAVAVLPDGRVVTGGSVRRPGAGVGPGGAGRRPGRARPRRGGVAAVAVLPDGRVVTASSDYGSDGRVLVWDPAEPGAGPAELGRHEGGVAAVAVLPDGRVVTGGDDDRVRLWDVQSSSPGSSARMLRVRARYLPLPIWSSPLHRSRTGRNFMLGGTPSDTEHAWSPATCGVTRCINRRECPQGPG